MNAEPTVSIKRAWLRCGAAKAADREDPHERRRRWQMKIILVFLATTIYLGLLLGLAEAAFPKRLAMFTALLSGIVLCLSIQWTIRAIRDEAKR